MIWPVLQNNVDMADATQQNLLQTEKIDRDGSIPMTGPLILPPTHVEASAAGIYEDDITLIRTFRPTGADGYNHFIGQSGNATLSPGGGASSLASRNICIGTCSGWDLTTAFDNTLMGIHTGQHITTGSANVIIGAFTGINIVAGKWNTIVGGGAAEVSSGADSNTVIGYSALLRGNLSANNVIVGKQAGVYLVDNGGCVFIGNQAGYWETGANKLFIDNTAHVSEADARTKAMMYGIFYPSTPSQYLYINANVAISEVLAVGQTGSYLAAGGAVITGNAAALASQGTAYGVQIYQPTRTVSANETNNLFGIQVTNGGFLPISSGKSDSGYRRAFEANYAINDAAFQGTLASQFGLRLSYGIYSGPGIITNCYGLYLYAFSTSGTITNKYGVYQANTDFQNYFEGQVYCVGNCSALSFTDRTKYPKDKAEAWAAIKSMKADGKGGLDHDALHDFVKSKHRGTRRESGEEHGAQIDVVGRDMSATISALVEALKDAEARIKKFETTH